MTSFRPHVHCGPGCLKVFNCAVQGVMPQGVTALPISEGLSMGYIPVSLPGMQVNYFSCCYFPKYDNSVIWLFCRRLLLVLFPGCTVWKVWRLSREGEALYQS